MVDPGPCELHEVGLFLGTDDSRVLLQLARSPIADECRMCSVCRLAREYMEVRIAELSGHVFPPEENGAAIQRELQSAVNAVKATHHRPIS